MSAKHTPQPCPLSAYSPSAGCYLHIGHQIIEKDGGIIGYDSWLTILLGWCGDSDQSCGSSSLPLLLGQEYQGRHHLV